jgi:hypothetical protein
MNSSPKRIAPGLGIAGAANLRLLAAYRSLLIAQPRRAVRQCVACGTRVTNRSLGGWSGRSAMTGGLWCAECADHPRQLMLSFQKTDQ